MLKNLEISGFKSFAKKGGLEFTSPISAIVGPNGSGKSNVAEAFRFVLGEQSLKSLRGKRGEDMIFSGTKTERALNRASVKVVFDNSKRFLDIDYDEVIIERIVHRDGGNQYLINKSQVRLKDITELLAGANIGSSGHHIISQGESDRILSVNPKERKQMIEEALGLRVYQYKITESERKLEKVENNIKEVESLKREITPHLRFLKRQVKKIEQSVELKDKLKELYKEYFAREDKYLKEQKKYIEKNKSPLEKEMSNLNSDLEKAKKVLAEEKNENQYSGQVLETENKLQEVRKEKDELSRKIGQVEGMISFEERRIKTEEDKQKQEDDRVIKFGDVRSFLNDLRASLSESGLEKIKELIDDFITRNSRNVGVAEIDQSELNKLSKEQKKLEKEIVAVSEKEKEILVEYNELKERIEKEKDSSRKAEVKVFEISAKQSEIRSELNTLNELAKKIGIEDENYKMELKEAFVLAGRDAIQFQNFEVSDIEEERNIQENRRREIEKIKIKLEDMGGGSDEEIMKEYKETEERNEFLKREIHDLEKSATSLVDLIKELKEKLDVEFREGVEKINNQFNEFFVLMFGGGKAQLKTVKIKKRKKKSDLDLSMEIPTDLDEDEDDDNPDNVGIEVDVSLPNKRTKGLQMLSGGERSLTSIALLFAMSQIKPPPFIILDETDAALDEANSKRYGDMIENLSKYSQLILITHNRETMSRAGVLYGITMAMDGVSRLLSVKLEEAVKVAK